MCVETIILQAMSEMSHCGVQYEQMNGSYSKAS